MSLETNGENGDQICLRLHVPKRLEWPDSVRVYFLHPWFPGLLRVLCNASMERLRVGRIHRSRKYPDIKDWTLAEL